MSTDLEGAGYALVEPGQALRRIPLPLGDLGPDEVVVAVAGCGVCHTDVGFAYEGVPTRHPLPLVLGHEIVGRVVSAGAAAATWVGRDVIVPAVIPCGACAACAADRPTVCARQFMPGNDGHGGFATHVRVPARGLCAVPATLPAGVGLADLAVVADAVTTPLEAVERAGLGPDDVAVWVGAGGVGGFGVQISAARGAAVAAIDVDPARLELAAAHGAALTLEASRGFKEIKSALQAFARASGRRGVGLKVFEASGTAAGQLAAFGLLDAGGHLGVVGYSPAKVELRLSNLMALDATARGNWGCAPARYPAALALVLAGEVRIAPFVERHALDDAPAVLEAVHARALGRRPVLVPSR